MVQEYLDLLPGDLGVAVLRLAMLGSLIGVGIWVLGARYSRFIITLLTVLLGGAIGMHLPAWCGWDISGAGPAVGAALVLGVTGYVLHGMWVGIGFGCLLACWATLGIWIGFRNGASWTWPSGGADVTAAQYAQAIWQSLPPDVARLLPFAAATALISGLALSILWPKVALLVGWSLAGVTLLTGTGTLAMEIGRPELLTRIPSPTWAQAAIIALLVSLGALIQWQLAPRAAVAKPRGGSKGAKKKTKPKHDFDDDDD